METKHELRAQYKSKRLKLSKSFVEEASQDVCMQVRQLKEYQSAKVIAIYSPIYQEVSPLGLLADSSKLFCFPKIMDFAGTEMEFFESGSHFVSGTYDILEPTGKFISKSQIDVIIVPGLVFSKEGYRIGYGKGFYDRYLADFSGITIGILYDFQLQDQIPFTETDTPLHILVTNKEVLCIAL